MKKALIEATGPSKILKTSSTFLKICNIPVIKRRNYVKKSLLYTALLILIPVYLPILFGQDSQSHPFVTNEKLCNVCHVTYLSTGTSGNTASFIIIKADSSRLPTDVCLECHPQKAATHPIQITTSYSVPKDLPLSKTRKIACTTCHNPHIARFSDRSWIPRSIFQKLNDLLKRKKQYKTFFLRRNNAEGELCMSCHKPLLHH